MNTVFIFTEWGSKSVYLLELNHFCKENKESGLGDWHVIDNTVKQIFKICFFKPFRASAKKLAKLG
jgi:hypothetical protein